MVEFVDLNDQLNIVPYDSISVENVELDSIIIGGQITPTETTEPYVTTTEPGIESLAILEQSTQDALIDIITIPESSSEGEPECLDDPTCEECDVAHFYGDTYPDSTFKRENLFSELVDEYQRAVARKNLGLSDEYAML